MGALAGRPSERWAEEAFDVRGGRLEDRAWRDRGTAPDWGFGLDRACWTALMSPSSGSSKAPVKETVADV